MEYDLFGITKEFDEWISLSICPDCGGDLDYNDECPGWYSEKPNPQNNLKKLIDKNNSKLL